MLGLGKPKPVDEYEARGETERVYHQIRQTLRVTGVNLNFRTWAAFEEFFPAMWDAVQPNLETRIFEDAADRIRAEAVHAADALGRVAALAEADLGESQTFQVRAALNLYHYVNPKLLVLTSAVRLALRGESLGQPGSTPPELIQRGAPAGMYPMEMVDDDPESKQVESVFRDIKKTLGLSQINSDYRTLALWPDYLEAAWKGLKPVTQRDEYRQAADALRERSRTLARRLPHPVALTREQVEALGEDADEVIQTTEKFEQLLPGLILNIALLALDWTEPEELARSPFPAPAAQIAGGAR